MNLGRRAFKGASCRIAIPDLPEDMRTGIREVVDLQSSNPRKGHATSLMRSICTEADVGGFVLLLRPLVFAEGLSQEQLEKWYAKLGFYEVQAEPKLMARPVRGYIPASELQPTPEQCAAASAKLDAQPCPTDNRKGWA